MGVLCEALQRHCAAGGITDQALQLIPPMRRDLSMSVQGKAVHTGTPRTGEPWRLTLRAKARTNAPDRLTRPLATGDALLHGGCHGTGKRRLVVEEGIIPRGHGVIDTCFQVSQVTQLANDPPTDFLDHVGDVGVGRRLNLDKAGLEACLSAIAVDALKKDTMKMQMEEKSSITPCRPP